MVEKKENNYKYHIKYFLQIKLNSLLRRKTLQSTGNKFYFTCNFGHQIWLNEFLTELLSVCLLIFMSHFSSFTPKKYNVYYLHIADIVMPPNPRYSVETMHCVHIWLLLYWFLNAYVGIKENHNIIEWFRCFTYWFKIPIDDA